MAYKQSPMSVLKGQMKNKAAGLMLKDSESGLMMMGAKMKKDKKISTGRKILNTAGQLIKDVGYQARDLITPDPIRVGGQMGRRDKLNMQLLKQQEQKNYDISRDRVKKGETYFSIADKFDDSGYGAVLGVGKRSKRGESGSSKPGALKDKKIQRPSFPPFS